MSNRQIQVFAVLKEIHSEVSTVSFPSLFGSIPNVTFGDMDEENVGHLPETIHINHRVRDGDQQWIGNRRKEETVTTEIDIRTAHKGQTAEDVLDRLEELTNAIYELWHLPAGGFTPPGKAVGTHILDLGGVVSCRVNVFPHSDGGGYQGVATLVLQTTARITT